MTPAIPDEAVQAAHAEYHKVLGDSNRSNPMHAALTAAAPFLQGVKVKALEWSGEPPYHVARTETKGFYCLEAIWNESGFVHVELTGSIVSGKTFATVDEAKAAAQADYEARILSAIEASALEPSPRAQALEEAHIGLLNRLNDDIAQLVRMTEQAKFAGDETGVRVKSPSILLADLRDAAAAICALLTQPVADGWLPIDDTAKSGRIVRIAYNRDDVSMADAFYRDGKWHGACVFYRHGVGKPPYEFREHKILESLVFAYRPLPASPGASE
ncbi:hypothetical protein CQ062_13730 [Ochrobactrum sp. MYb68]|nr:hypothetical protein CQ062_13730 [Ochrobactrum sp. MYb68]